MGLVKQLFFSKATCLQVQRKYSYYTVDVLRVASAHYEKVQQLPDSVKEANHLWPSHHAISILHNNSKAWLFGMLGLQLPCNYILLVKLMSLHCPALLKWILELGWLSFILSKTAGLQRSLLACLGIFSACSCVEGGAPSIQIISSLMQQKAYHSIVDFDNHLDDVRLDWRNLSINSLIELELSGSATA